MPNIEVTKEELEALITCVMEERLHGYNSEESLLLPDLHLKLENALELWINGGVVEIPVPAHLKKLGVQKWEKEYPPHPEECVRHG